MTAGLWPWKSASAKECVTTHRPNVGALKMDGAKLAVELRPGRPVMQHRLSRQVRWASVEVSWGNPEMEPPVLQILVIVANIQAIPL